MKLSKPAAVALILVTFALYVFLSVAPDGPRDRPGATSHSDAGLGLSLFLKLHERIAGQRGGGGPERVGHALLHEGDLGGLDTLFVAGPQRPISADETEIIRDFVEDGGHLVLTFHDEATHGVATSLAAALGLATDSRPNPRFKNGETITVKEQANEDDAGPIFSFKDTYVMYGMYTLDGDGCDGAPPLPLHCFARREKVGDGDVLVIASLPPFANAMLRLGDNRRAAARLAAWSGIAGFDEYHHFFSDRTAKDLWLTPSFTLPLAGLIATVLLFLLSSSRWRPGAGAYVQTSATPAARTYHEVNVDVLAAQMRRGGFAASALARQSALIGRLFPPATVEIKARLATGQSAGAQKRRASGKMSADLVSAASQQSARDLLKVHGTQLERIGRRRRTP